MALNFRVVMGSRNSRDPLMILVLEVQEEPMIFGLFWSGHIR